MSDLRVTNLKGRTPGSSPTLPDGVVVTGISTATSFDGDLTGNADTATYAPTAGIATYAPTAGIATNAQGLTGTPNLNVGIITATEFSGDGSNLDNIKSGITTFIASGSISNGDAVIVNADGTVSVVSGVGSLSPHAGTPAVFESATTSEISSTYDSTNQKVVIAYRDNANGNNGTAIVGTVSGTSISFGTPVVFESASTSNTSVVYDSTNQKVVIAYSDDGNLNYGTAVVGTVSGTSISFGLPTVFNSFSTINISATFDSTNDKVVIAYTDGGNNSFGTAIVGTVSGTSISFGTPVVFESASTSYISAIYDSANQKVVVAYQDFGNSQYGTAIVGTVSGTSISFGAPVLFESAQVFYVSATYDSANQKVVIAYRGGANSDSGTAIVGTVSGTRISFSPPVVFEFARTDYISATYDSANNRVVITYQDDGNSSYGTVIDGVVNASSVNIFNHNITFGIPTVFESASTSEISATYDSTNQKVVVAYQDEGNSFYGTASVITSTNLSSNLSDKNYIGIAAEAISDTATGKITIAGGINSGQVGLTTAETHYVSPIDGSLSVSPYGEGVPGIPIVVAGTSISSTKIIVKG